MKNRKSVVYVQLHGEMCKQLFHYICKVSEIFPGLEGTRPGSKTGIQALCNLHVNIEKAADLLQYCSNTSKFYLVRNLDYAPEKSID